MRQNSYQCSEETRNRLTAAVISLAEEKAYETITVKEICRAARVSTGSFYHQFRSKDDLVLAAYTEVDNLVTDQVIEENSHIPPLDALDQLLRRYVVYVRDEIGHVLAQYYRVVLNNPDPARDERDRPYSREIRRLLLLAERDGSLIAEIDPREGANFILRLLRGMFMDWLMCGRSYDLMARYEQEVRMMLFLMARRDNGENKT